MEWFIGGCALFALVWLARRGIKQGVGMRDVDKEGP